MRKQGFTLIELLVVISIIGILATLALSSYSGAQKQARDTERKSDLQQYRNALETYAFTNSGSYYTTSGNLEGFCAAGQPLEKIMASCPVDPDTTYDYQYLYASSAYLIYANLETTGGYWFICSNGKVDKIATAPTNLTPCQ